MRLRRPRHDDDDRSPLLTRSNIERAFAQAGKQTHALQASDLALLEDFHTLGRLATVALIDLGQISPSDRVLDAGTGLGGTARLIAAERGARVTAIDLTPEYCEVAIRVRLIQAVLTVAADE